MSFILSINSKTKRPECEIGDIVAVYDFKPTSTEKDIFDITEVSKIKAPEIMEHLEKDVDPEKKYPKFKTNLKNLNTLDKNNLRNSFLSVTEIKNIIKKIKIKNPLVSTEP